MLRTLRQVCRRLVRVLHRADSHPDVHPSDLLMLSGHEDLRAISTRLTAVKAEIDRSLDELRDWSRELEQRLGPMQDELVRTRSLRSLGETIGGLAHNFNNSLAAIVAYAELLMRERGDAASATRQLAVIRQIALEAGASVRHLQEYVARQTHVAFGPVMLDAVMADALALTEPRWRDEAERRGVRVTIARDVEGAPPVEGSPADLRDIFVHLILSAVSAMSAGGTLTIRARGEASGWVTVTFADTAQGARDLNVAAAIAERQGGSLAVEVSGDGTAVTLRLLGSRYQVIPAAASAPAPGVLARRILLVDDDPRLRRALADILEAHGHAVTDLGSGAEALAHLETADVDLVITDLGMPEMTGWEVAAAVKARRPRMPVFLLTGWGTDVTADDRSLLVDRVIPKPVSTDALLSYVGSVQSTPAGAN